MSPPVKLTIVGCGQVGPVADYKKRTKCPYPVYSDPSKKLYKALDMVEHLGIGDKHPEYIKTGLVSGVFSSLFTALSAGGNMLKGGDFAQNGGELLFVDGKLKWIHRMQNTRDHAEIAELEKVLAT